MAERLSIPSEDAFSKKKNTYICIPVLLANPLQALENKQKTPQKTKEIHGKESTKETKTRRKRRTEMFQKPAHLNPNSVTVWGCLGPVSPFFDIFFF